MTRTRAATLEQSCRSRRSTERPTTGAAGVVLAGGFSRRFGEGDKALATLEGRPLLARVVDRVGQTVDRIVVSCRRSQIGDFEDALPAAVPVAFVPDEEPDRGPLAGVERSLAAIDAPRIVVTACDVPFVEPRLLDRLLDGLDEHEAAIPRASDGRLQPAQAAYRTAALERALETLDCDGSALRGLVEVLDAVHVSVGGRLERSFRNVNTRRELAALRESVEEAAPSQS